MTNKISHLADIHADARIAADVTIGPFCRIGPHVEIGEGTILDNNVTIIGHTTLGCGNRCFPGVVMWWCGCEVFSAPPVTWFRAAASSPKRPKWGGACEYVHVHGRPGGRPGLTAYSRTMRVALRHSGQRWRAPSTERTASDCHGGALCATHSTATSTCADADNNDRGG